MLIGKVWIYRLLFVCVCFVILCVCMVTDFSTEDKASGGQILHDSLSASRNLPFWGTLIPQKPKIAVLVLPIRRAKLITINQWPQQLETIILTTWPGHSHLREDFWPWPMTLTFSLRPRSWPTHNATRKLGEEQVGALRQSIDRSNQLISSEEQHWHVIMWLFYRTFLRELLIVQFIDGLYVCVA